MDSPIKIQNKSDQFGQCYIMIPLHNTPSEMGGTSYYNNEYVEKYKGFINKSDEECNKIIGNGFGYFDELKGGNEKRFSKGKIHNTI